ncbi:MAG TPA: hypothetical protein PK609_01945 [Candidatus Paceibacterota bacterium]|nr:hypothetical protein [Candidatus Paceibacterota bacterium]
MKVPTGIVITERGKNSFEAEQQKLKKNLLKDRKGRPDANARSAGSTGCGMRMQGENAREDDLNLERISVIQQILCTAQVAPEPENRSVVRIGHVITLMYREGSGKRKRVRKTYEIVGYQEGDCDTNPPRLSYLAELARQFMGQEIGHQAYVRMAGRLRFVTLTNIRKPKLPNQ